MKGAIHTRKKRFAVFSFVIVLAILVGVGTELVWRLLERRSYDDLLCSASEEFGVPVAHIYATIETESDFDANARSNKGAIGLMQILPSTFEWLTGEEHLDENLPSAMLFDPSVNIRYGTYYLSYLYEKFDQDWRLAHIAYNAGEGNLRAWLKNPEYVNESGELTYIPFPQTEKYLERIDSVLRKYQKSEETK